MSQKVVIERVRLRGAAPYLGMCKIDGGGYAPFYSENPDVVMDWLCDAWRCRYNQLRSRRQKWDREKEGLVPVGRETDMRTDRQVREECSWLAAVPAMVLQSPNRIENTDWWAANKRRKTLKKKGQNPGSMPRFKEKHGKRMFVCWYNNGANARYRRLNKHHGEVVITGQNPGKYKLDGQPCRWELHIRVRVSQRIRAYTSVGVHWDDRTLVFINEPLPVERRVTGAMVGIDRGVKHTLALSDGTFQDLPHKRLKKIDKRIRSLQKSQARRFNMSGKTMKEYRKNPSKTYKRVQKEIGILHRKAHNIINDWQQKTTTRLVRDYDIISMENLQLSDMTKKAKKKEDPNNPKRYLPNGQAAKRGLNRSMRAASLGGISQKLEYKTQLSMTNRLVLINPAYTSQTCSECHYCAK